jgi:hypothetical protein
MIKLWFSIELQPQSIILKKHRQFEFKTNLDFFYENFSIVCRIDSELNPISLKILVCPILLPIFLFFFNYLNDPWLWIAYKNLSWHGFDTISILQCLRFKPTIFKLWV